MSDSKSFLEKIDQQKQLISKVRPFEGEILRQIKEYYKIGLTYTSNALEGNTLTESETKVVLEDGITVAGKPIRDYYEAEGHGLAFDKIFDIYKKDNLEEEDILNLHKLFYHKIDSENAGKYREVQAIITGSKYPLPTPDKLEDLMLTFVDLLNSDKEHPVILAAKLHKEFSFIHPFVDGNGRVARLIMNLILIRNGYLISIIPPIKRVEYIQLLEKAHEDDSEFIVFIVERVYENQKEMIRLLNLTK